MIGLPLLLVVLAQAADKPAPPDEAAARFELVEVRKIWDGAPHNAFTDLVRHRDGWLCVFREGSGHVPGTNGTIRVLHSADGAKWQSTASVREAGIDLRDPKISLMPDGRLMLLMGGSTYAGNEGPQSREFVSARSRAAFSKDGRSWSTPKTVSVEGEWLWRVTWHKKIGYGFAYPLSGPTKDAALTLWKTSDGLQYEPVKRKLRPESCWPSEAAARFLADDTMVALVRGEQPGGHAFVGTSRPPYTDWKWADAGHSAQGPDFLVAPDGRMFYGGRDVSAGPKTVVGLLSPRIAKPLLTLPSGGDTSYPGLVWHDGQLWISYYASHEGKAAIYLARVRVTPPDQSRR
jgi:hypothetical protein